MSAARLICLSLCAIVALTTATPAASERPSLVLTANGVERILTTNGSYPLFDRSLRKMRTRIERSMIEGVVVPSPKDAGGGYTHERHKENYKIIHDAGFLYQVTKNEAYADHVTEILLAYAEIYKNLPLHPEKKRQAPGKLFWQTLNEAVWLVYAIQGYDAVAETVAMNDRETIENDLFRVMADFLSLGNPETFRKIHNHGTWAAAAVGMTGYALRDPALVERALYGIDGDRTSGFLAQLDQLFSPDGYYAEGPYYQRYALMPFVLFARAIENNDPERKIFQYRDGIILKAIDATIQQSYAGKFFPINDAIKEKGLDTPELIYAIATAYDLTKDDRYLSIAEYQGRTVPTGRGLNVARAVAAGKARPFNYKPMLLRDGPAGDRGGLAVLRMGDDALAQTIVVKNTSHGMGHGHFDKLSYIFYDNGSEILNDYGAVRFLNVPTKDGGRYLPENDSWAKQTIAHNTLTVNERSQFDGDMHISQKYWPSIVHYEQTQTMNVVSASLTDAYPATTITRTIIQLDHEAFAAPIIIDLLRAKSEKSATYDLPFYFDGQVVDVNGVVSTKTKIREPLGASHGYEHLWVEATVEPFDSQMTFSWLNNRRFYTIRSLVPPSSEAVFVRTGANDPNFNLRSQQGLIIRAPRSRNATFVSVIEPHGNYDPAAEITAGSDSQISRIALVSEEAGDVILLELKNRQTLSVAISYDPDPVVKHVVSKSGRRWEWFGFSSVMGD